MRLSEDRIVDLSYKIVGRILDDDLIYSDLDEDELIEFVKKIIINDLSIEDEIEAETKKIMSSYSRNIPEGSSEYKAMYMKTREDIAKRKNYVL
ncbi:MAG: DUF507 family protein [bacterium]|nr:DUF507 family protein [bacterium]